MLLLTSNHFIRMPNKLHFLPYNTFYSLSVRVVFKECQKQLGISFDVAILCYF